MGKRICAFLLAVAAAAAGAAEPGVSFRHKDWQLACDNTRTCRAAGYSREEGEGEPVSVLLTRPAGAGAPVSGELALGSVGREKFPPQVTLRIDGRPAGVVPLKRDQGALSAAQVSALVAALTGGGEIVFAAGPEQWRLSGAGAAAVLLKMDEAQGRVGTRGALARTGPAAETRVLPPLPVPVVEIPSLAAAQPGDAALAARIRPALAKFQDRCEDLATGKEPLQLWRLDAAHLLVSTRCWLAAYNSGSGFWVVDDAPPYRARLVTTDGSDYDGAGRITLAQKERGAGDCATEREWAWNGREFVPTLASTSGLCRGVAEGGPWALPTRVTEVRAAGALARTTEGKSK